MDKDESKKGSESTDSTDPETDNPLKEGNIYRLLDVKGIEKYKVNNKEFQYVTDLANTTNNLSPANYVPLIMVTVNNMKLEVKGKFKDTEDTMQTVAPSCCGKNNTSGKKAKYLQEKLTDLKTNQIRMHNKQEGTK